MTYRDQVSPPKVRCCRCGQEVELAKTDIVELGYQCTVCVVAAPRAGFMPRAADPALDVYVPAGALIKPAGAAPNLDGTVSCVACGQPVALAQADIVGEGYRCAACSHRAEVARAHGESDIGSHLSKRDRRELAGGAANVGGVMLIIGGVVLLAATGGSVGWFLTIGGVVSLLGSSLRR